MRGGFVSVCECALCTILTLLTHTGLKLVDRSVLPVACECVCVCVCASLYAAHRSISKVACAWIKEVSNGKYHMRFGWIEINKTNRWCVWGVRVELELHSFRRRFDRILRRSTGCVCGGYYVMPNGNSMYGRYAAYWPLVSSMYGKFFAVGYGKKISVVLGHLLWWNWKLWKKNKTNKTVDKKNSNFHQFSGSIHFYFAFILTSRINFRLYTSSKIYWLYNTKFNI